MARDNETQDDELEGVDTMDADDGGRRCRRRSGSDDGEMMGGTAGGRGSAGGSRKGARGSQRSAGGARKSSGGARKSSAGATEVLRRIAQIVGWIAQICRLGRESLLAGRGSLGRVAQVGQRVRASRRRAPARPRVGGRKGDPAGAYAQSVGRIAQEDRHARRPEAPDRAALVPVHADASADADDGDGIRSRS